MENDSDRGYEYQRSAGESCLRVTTRQTKSSSQDQHLFSPYTKKIHTYNNIYHKNIDNYSYTNYKYLQTLYMNTSLVEVL